MPVSEDDKNTLMEILKHYKYSVRWIAAMTTLLVLIEIMREVRPL